MAEVDLRQWAMKGAEQRLLEIADEAAKIYAAFPELRGRDVGVRGRRARGGPAVQQPQQKRGARKMSAEARRRIAEAQKKRWAAWRETKKAEATEATPRKRSRKSR